MTQNIAPTLTHPLILFFEELFHLMERIGASMEPASSICKRVLVNWEQEGCHE